MSTVTNSIPTPVLIGALVVLIVSFVYAMFIGTPLAWLALVLALASLGLVTFLIYLFYRLVIAVEQIAANL